jgi:NAD(P)-dependent dehydrogenase (short-subunit alcohol dehydrogenase family)
MPSVLGVSELLAGRSLAFSTNHLEIVTATSMTRSILPSNASELGQVNAAQPLKGVGDPHDVARIAVVLGSDDVSWVTGISVPVDGGFLCQ